MGAVSRGCSLGVVCGLLLEAASLVAERGLRAHRLLELWLVGSRAQAQ